MSSPSGKPTRADASHALDYAPDEALDDGARVAGRGFTLEAVATPGHAANHLASRWSKRTRCSPATT